MTLLEAVIAFVLLSVVGVVCLEQTSSAARLQASSAEWTQAVAVGEATLAAVGGTGANSDFGLASVAPMAARSTGTAIIDAGNSDGGALAVRVERTRWRSGLDRVTVSVPLRNGGAFTLTRLVAASRGQP